MGEPTIKVIDAIHAKVNKKARKIIKNALAYQSVDWKRNRRTGRKEQQIKRRHLITGRKGTGGTILVGLIPRVKKYAKKKGYKIEVIKNGEKITPTSKPYLKGITFRPDQKKALRAVKRRHRGKIVFPTGSGKTVIAGGIMSMFPECRILFLCHTKDLLFQTMHALESFGFKVTVHGGGYKMDNPKKIFKKSKLIMLSTIQSYINIPPELRIGFFDITIVDEVHHVNARDSQYGQIMESNLSPRRYGLTATDIIECIPMVLNSYV